MNREIKRAETKKQGEIRFAQAGFRSSLSGIGFAPTNQFGVWEEVGEVWEDKKIWFNDVKLPNWSDDREEQDKIAKEMSGEVKVYHIDDLPEEERERYERK